MVERTLSFSYVYLLVDKTMCNQKRRPKGGDFLCARFPSCVFLCARIPSCGIEKWYDIAFRTYVPARTRSVDRNMNINCGRPNIYIMVRSQVVSNNPFSLQNVSNNICHRLVINLDFLEYAGNVPISKYKQRALICCVARLETPSDGEVMIQNVLEITFQKLSLSILQQESYYLLLNEIQRNYPNSNAKMLSDYF